MTGVNTTYSTHTHTILPDNISRGDYDPLVRWLAYEDTLPQDINYGWKVIDARKEKPKGELTNTRW